MKIKVLASGSKGNTTLVEIENKKILIDAGITLSNANKRLETPIDNVDLIIITHIHDDHIKGLSSYIKKFNPLILTKSTDLELKIKSDKILISDNYNIDNINIKLFNLSHDAPCTGISIKKDKELIYITDTGYINKKILEEIQDKDMYIIESNHDVEMLRNGKYPFYLQQRILGDKGHLSNEDCSKYISKIITDKTKNIVLAHLSEENNLRDLAYQTTYEIIKEKNINLYVASQEQALDWIDLK